MRILPGSEVSVRTDRPRSFSAVYAAAFLVIYPGFALAGSCSASNVIPLVGSYARSAAPSVVILRDVLDAVDANAGFIDLSVVNKIFELHPKCAPSGGGYFVYSDNDLKMSLSISLPARISAKDVSEFRVEFRKNMANCVSADAAIKEFIARGWGEKSIPGVGPLAASPTGLVRFQRGDASAALTYDQSDSVPPTCVTSVVFVSYR